MDALLCLPPSLVERWRSAFSRVMPALRLHVWPSVPDVVDVALVWKPPAVLFDSVRIRLAIVNLGAGADGLVSVPTLPRDLPIVRLEDAGMAEQMAEYVTLAVLGAYRQQREYALQQAEARWTQHPRIPKPDFAVGLAGLGILGRSVAAALAGFGFPLLGWSRTPKELPGVTTFAGRDGLGAMLGSVEVLVLLLPSTPRTRNLFDRATLSQLPRGAHLVNVARGDLVVDEDLVALLDSGHLASATLDVFRAEPLPPSHPFWHHPRVTLTPHVSAITLPEVSAAQIADKLAALARGQAVTGCVDLGRGY